MTKEQIQEAAEREYPASKNHHEWAEWATRLQREAYIKGINAALNSDTVKGMAEALDKFVKRFGDLMVFNFDDFRLVEQAHSALRNYEQSIKTA